MGQNQPRTEGNGKMQEKEKPQEAMRSKADFKPANPMVTNDAAGTGKRENPGRPC